MGPTAYNEVVLVIGGAIDRGIPPDASGASINKGEVAEGAISKVNNGTPFSAINDLKKSGD